MMEKCKKKKEKGGEEEEEKQNKAKDGVKDIRPFKHGT